MTCTQTQFLLDAHADHALGIRQAFRVRRHLAGCAACTAQMADIQRLSDSVHAWRTVPVPAALEGQIAAALPQAASVPMPPRDRRVVRRAAVGLAGVTAATAAGFWLLPGHLSQPTIAFADVEQAMQQVQTVSWDETWEFYGPAGPSAQSATSQNSHWLRRNPPALASVEHLQGRFQDLADERGDLVRLAPGVYAVFKPHPGRGAAAKPIREEADENLRRFTQPQTGKAAHSATFRHGTTQTESSLTQQRPVILNGQKCILFSRVEETVLTLSPGGQRHYFFALNLWADPTTHRVVRAESRNTQRENPEDWQVITLSGFRYDQTPPPGVFDWSPPPGAKVLTGPQAWDALLYFTRHPVH